MDAPAAEEKEPQWISPCWYLAPILVGVAGGIIAYFALRNRDRPMAKLLIVVGIAAELAMVLLFDVFLFDECSMFYGWLPLQPVGGGWL